MAQLLFVFGIAAVAYAYFNEHGRINIETDFGSR